MDQLVTKIFLSETKSSIVNAGELQGKLSLFDILTKWDSIASKNNDTFARQSHLDLVLKNSEITEFLIGISTPDITLANYLMSVVPTSVSTPKRLITSALVALRNPSLTSVSTTREQYRTLRLTQLKRIAHQNTNATHTSGSSSRLYELLSERIRKICDDCKRPTDTLVAMRNIAKCLQLSYEELIGLYPLCQNRINDKANELASLLDLNTLDYDNFVRAAKTTWIQAEENSKLGCSKMLRFLRVSAGLTLEKAGKNLKLSIPHITCIERGQSAITDTVSRVFFDYFGLSDTEKLILEKAISENNDVIRKRHLNFTQIVGEKLGIKNDGASSDRLTQPTYFPQAINRNFVSSTSNKIIYLHRYFQDSVSDTINDLSKWQRTFSRHLSVRNANPNTLIGKMERTQDHFSEFGLTIEKCLKSFFRAPTVFTISSCKLISRIEKFNEFISDASMDIGSRENFFVRLPDLFVRKPERLVYNFEFVLNQFTGKGLTREIYIDIVHKWPNILTRKPQTICERIKYVANIYHHKSPKSPPTAEDNMNPLFLQLKSTPAIICASEINLGLRFIYLIIVGTSKKNILNSNLTTDYMERKISNALGYRGLGEFVKHSEKANLAQTKPSEKTVLVRHLVKTLIRVLLIRENIVKI
jgi:transcriptional regulator with XRE-family HTH domain